MEPLYKFIDDQYMFKGVTHTREIARAILLDEHDNVCLEYLLDDDGFGPRDYYETPGGGIKTGETHEQAIKREIEEEVGYECEIISFLGEVDDYYNLINRHNINNYFLCKKISVGDNHLTKEEANIFHLTTLKIKYDDAVKEYERCAVNGLGRLIKNRELPILKEAYKILQTMDNA